MNIHLKIIAFVLLLLLASCESVEVVESNVAFEQKIVVQSELLAERVYVGVYLTKTLPISEEYEISKAEITDAVCYLRVDDAQIIPLHYTSAGLYKPLYDITTRSGSEYELFGEAEGTKFYSKTYVPYIPDILSTTISDGHYIKSELRAQHLDVFGSRWVVRNNSNDIIATAADFHSLILPTANSLFSVFIRTEEIPEIYLTGNFKDNLFYYVYAFDEQYLLYYKTKGNNEPVDNTFAQGGGPINWNVFGENVIGLFIGIAESPLVKVRN